MNKNAIACAAAFVICTIFSSCIELKQVTHIKDDGSGFMSIHYWTHLSNLSMGDEIGDFAFSEIKARNFLTSATTDVREITIESNTPDSTIHVKAVLNFTEFSKLNNARTFSKFVTSWEKAGGEYRFRYLLSKDSVKSGSFLRGKNRLYYEFNFPGEIVSSNGKSFGNKAEWEFEVSKLAEGINMQAQVKAGNAISQIFRIETLVIVILLILALITYRNIRRSQGRNED